MIAGAKVDPKWMGGGQFYIGIYTRSNLLDQKKTATFLETSSDEIRLNLVHVKTPRGRMEPQWESNYDIGIYRLKINIFSKTVWSKSGNPQVD